MHLWTKYENSNTQFKVWWIIEIIVKVMSIKILIKEYSQFMIMDPGLGIELNISYFTSIQRDWLHGLATYKRCESI